jgi:hypothetical protein
VARTVGVGVPEQLFASRDRFRNRRRTVIEGSGDLAEARRRRPADVSVADQGVLGRILPAEVTPEVTALDEPGDQTCAAERPVVTDGLEERNCLGCGVQKRLRGRSGLVHQPDVLDLDACTQRGGTVAGLHRRCDRVLEHADRSGRITRASEGRPELAQQFASATVSSRQERRRPT